MLKHSAAMEDHKVPLLVKPPHHRPSPLIYIPLKLISLLIYLLLTIMCLELFLLIPSYVTPVLAQQAVISVPFPWYEYFDGAWRKIYHLHPDAWRKVYHLHPTLSLTNPDGKVLDPDVEHGDFVAQGCLYRNNTFVSIVRPQLMYWDRKKMKINMSFDMDVEDSRGLEGLTFDLWTRVAYVLPEPGSWFEKIRVTKVVCKDVKAPYLVGWDECKAKTWPILGCRWYDIYRRWLLMMYSKARKTSVCPEEPSLEEG